MRPSSRHADLGVGLVLFLLLATTGMAVRRVTNEIEARVACMSNLRKIAQAMLIYSDANNGAYPRTRWNIDDPKPVWGTPYEGDAQLGAAATAQEANQYRKDSKYAPAPNDVTSALFLLLRTQDINPDAFICPSTGQTPLKLSKAEAKLWTNWQGVKGLRDHLSYSLMNPYAFKPGYAAGVSYNNVMGPETAMAADMNPGVAELTKLNVNSTPLAMALGNSINHNRSGQSILYADGHVAWESIPFVGMQQDNIYTFGNSGKTKEDSGGEGIVGPAVGPRDTVLLPTAVDLGIIDTDGKLTDETVQRHKTASADWKPPAAEDLNAMRQRIGGTYTRDEAGRKLTLVISDDAMNVSAGTYSAKLNYQLEHLADNGVWLVVHDPLEGIPSGGHLNLTDNGVYLWKCGRADGQWVRQK